MDLKHPAVWMSILLTALLLTGFSAPPGTVLHIMADLPGLALQITAVDQVRGKLKAIIDAT